MNVDKLKKMNVLAHTLKQHGLAATREDAANLAGDMVGTNEDEEYSKVFVQPDQSISIHDEEGEQMQNEQTGEEQKELFDEKQVKNILQAFADQFSSEINKMSEKLDSQEERIRKLHEMMNNQPETQQTPEIEEKPEQTTIIEPEVRQEPTPEPVQQEQQPQSDSPRSGGFNSEDVAIDKFFYYGQK